MYVGINHEAVSFINLFTHLFKSCLWCTDTVKIEDINVTLMVSFCNVVVDEPYFYETNEVPAQSLPVSLARFIQCLSMKVIVSQSVLCGTQAQRYSGKINNKK